MALRLCLAHAQEGINGPAADVYSLGCLVFFLLRGDVPYDWEVARHRSSSMALDRYTLKAQPIRRDAPDITPLHDVHAIGRSRRGSCPHLCPLLLPVAPQIHRFRAQQEDPANDPWRGVADPMEALTARVRANDPFGKDEGEDDEDDEDVEDERPPPSAAAVEFVRWATR